MLLVMRRRIIGFSLLLTISLFPTNSVFGIQGGVSALGDEKVVSISGFPNHQGGCSGALVEPQVVFTAGHCLSVLTGTAQNPLFPSKIEISPLWVSAPGVEISISSKVETAQVTGAFRSKDFLPGLIDHGPVFDFAVLILDRPLSNRTFSIVTRDKLRQLVENSKNALAIGYGLVSWEDFQQQSSGKGKQPLPQKQVVNLRKDGIQLPKIPIPIENTLVQTLMPLGTNVCGGDSGSPLWIQEGEVWLYVGALSAANGPTCTTNPDDPIWKNEFWLKNRGGTYWSAQAFPEVIQDAKSFLRNQLQESFAKAEAEAKAKAEADAKAKAEADAKAKAEADAKAKAEAEAKASLSKKRTITCVKGKLIKKVTAVNPKCSRGYKKK